MIALEVATTGLHDKGCPSRAPADLHGGLVHLHLNRLLGADQATTRVWAVGATAAWPHTTQPHPLNMTSDLQVAGTVASATGAVGKAAVKAETGVRFP